MPSETPVLTEKQIATEALGLMPESASLRQISEELAILAAIREGEADAKAGRVVSHEEAMRRSAAWTLK
ncbi:hypothetical protein [Zavarzinella formosa]|uniref:hypothetical protein n=1 Tax=Zavarzinella formosa TaxID=360055 RepID=UPI0002DE73AD|nr:hypothetical protein [Zavarzinella formosa]